MPFTKPTRPTAPASVQWGGSVPPASPSKPGNNPRPPSVRRAGWVVAIVVAFLLGAGASPARADNVDRIVQLLDRISDSLRDIAHREPVKVVCECKS